MKWDDEVLRIVVWRREKKGSSLRVSLATMGAYVVLPFFFMDPRTNVSMWKP